MENLLLFVTLVFLGYIFGRIAEKRHYRSITLREQQYLQLPSTCCSLPIGKRQVAKAELVQGSVVISVDYFKRILALLRNFFGGQVRSYETLLDRGRREAILRLKESCPGADEIINVRIETSSISKGGDSRIGSVEILAYGTAVYFSTADPELP